MESTQNNLQITAELKISKYLLYFSDYKTHLGFTGKWKILKQKMW